MKYYSLKKILEKKCQYNMIIGERSTGKTYSVEDHILKNYCDTGKQGAILRRYHEDFKGKRGQAFFEALVNNGLVEKYTNGIWTGIYYFSGRWYLCRRDEKTPEKLIKDEKPFCYGFALTEMEHDKSTSYPGITTIMFDEFITRTGYLVDEFVLFMNCLSTIIRYRDDVTIFMLGNTVNKDCPYFAEMGLNHVGHMTPGTIDVYNYGDSKLKVAVEFTGNGKFQHNKPSDFYFAFDNSRLKMITNSVWELGIYPHKPVDFAPKDIKFIFFICYNQEVLQCEVVMKDKYNFIFVHRKTTEIRKPEKELIFDTEANPLYNINRKLNQGFAGVGSITAKIIQYIKNEKVFFGDNQTGEVFRNYLLWCNRSSLFN